jgi:hypothetical protein
VPAFVTSIEHRTDIGSLSREPAETLRMNDIGVATLTLLRPIAVDLYGENRSAGAFILIDAETNATVAAGMITAASKHEGSSVLASGPVTAEERAARWGHRGGVLELDGPVELIDRIERSLFARGIITARVEVEDVALGIHPAMVDALIRSKTLSGMVALMVTLTAGDTLTARSDGEQITLNAGGPVDSIAAIYGLLGRAGVLVLPENADWEI